MGMSYFQYQKNIFTSPPTLLQQAASMVLCQHSPLPPDFKQLAIYVLAFSCSFYPASKFTTKRHFYGVREMGGLFQNQLLFSVQHWKL
jgi:hypothetical protein